MPCLAAPAVPPQAQACIPDVRSLCAKEAAQFSRPKMKACLIRNVDRLSPACRTHIEAVRAQDAAAAR